MATEIDYKKAFEEICTRRRQALQRMRDVIGMLTTLVGDGKGEEWWLEQCKEALADSRASYDLIADHMDPDDILDELARL